ncbi:MAG: T9SS type A sorting domain-containing protein, partial [Bacteroidales bacterium]|nr:T9SS type A sorting domain-containing protein [Bacteroidales bacterium]
DGGANWSQQNSGTNCFLYSASFINNDVGIIVGDQGVILKTSNGGITWDLLNNGTTFNINSMHFTDINHGFTANFLGEFLMTSDGGENWTRKNIGTIEDLQAIFFIDSLTGFIAGPPSLIYKTIDGGNTWSFKNIGTGNRIVSLYFTNKDVGYGCGENGTIIKTEDAGFTWSFQNSPTTNYLSSIFFVNGQGFAVGVDGIILKQIVGTSTWQIKHSKENCWLESVYFVDPQYGFTVGSPGYIYKTINGGDTWIRLGDSSGYSGEHYQGVFFRNKNIGYIVGGYSYEGGLLSTTNDGGMTWISQSFNTRYDFTSICFPDTMIGYIAGEDGEIWKTNSGGLLALNDLSSLHRDTIIIYPNPTAEKFIIDFERTNLSEIITVEVYSIRGEKVFTKVLYGIVKHEFSLSNKPPGIYLIHVISGNKSATVKIIKQ